MARKPKPKKSEWAVLKPRELPNGKWQVSLGVEWVDGKRKNTRRIFANNADALKFCRDEEARRDAHGQITAGADGVEVAAWMKLDKQLMEAGAGSLKEVGNRILKDTIAVTEHSTARECLTRYLTTYLGKSVYTDDSRNRCNCFLKWFGDDRQMREATPEVMKVFFNKNPGKTLRRTISAWFGWAVDEGYLPSNPCARPKRRKGAKKKAIPKAVILSPSEASNLLKAAILAEDWTSLSFIALSLFAGIRPMEFRKKYRGAATVNLDWCHVTPGGIEIHPENAKTLARVVPILDPLTEWIEFIRAKKGILSGPVLAAGKRGEGWRKHWEQFRDKHWPHKWHVDLLRHSFGSYRLAKIKDPEKVSLEMGNSPAVLLRHYWNWKTLEPQALKFWALTPEVVMPKELKAAPKKVKKPA